VHHEDHKAERNFGQTDLAGVLLSDAKVGGERHLESAADPWPFSAAITSSGVCSRRLRVSFACRQKQYLKSGSAFSIASYASVLTYSKLSGSPLMPRCGGAM